METGKQNGVAGFLLDVLRGVGIGVAFIIPGFSGGSVAAILGVYEKLVGAVADIFRSFGKSLRVLLPYVLGIVLGVAALLLPIRWGLAHFPLPTVSLFVGLSLGGLPAVAEKVKGRARPADLPNLILPFAAAACLVFVPVGADVDLFSLDLAGYLLLALMGAVAACALVVPGISGSMLLLIFGYYAPLVDLTVRLFGGGELGAGLPAFACAAAGAVAGFFLISVFMRMLLRKFPRGTYLAIIGFILGSVVAAYAATVRSTPAELGYLYGDPWYFVASAAFLFVGAGLSLALYFAVRGRICARTGNPRQNRQTKFL